MTRTIAGLTSHRETVRFLRFSVVGVLGTIVDFGLLFVFKELVGFPTILANTLSYSAGIANNFVLNRLWTYPESREKRALVQLVQFAAVSVVGLTLNNAMVLAFEAPLGAIW